MTRISCEDFQHAAVCRSCFDVLTLDLRSDGLESHSEVVGPLVAVPLGLKSPAKYKKKRKRSHNIDVIPVVRHVRMVVI